ncbi:hypothetical protein M378DRAFT_1013436 [Amanita muscaria Koide BX008]|uniref:Uncharacterized protein n=1 Tax=Amanita muscaria (strain Koide BX008) TaxID=946122 RepID=A0A0C2SYT4_AMAMK|nr:hypothetical protein M378DRAFT_1013436 [Amanita muscaria Koide BX008]
MKSLGSQSIHDITINSSVAIRMQNLRNNTRDPKATPSCLVWALFIAPLRWSWAIQPFGTLLSLLAGRGHHSIINIRVRSMRTLHRRPNRPWDKASGMLFTISACPCDGG